MNMIHYSFPKNLRLSKQFCTTALTKVNFICIKLKNLNMRTLIKAMGQFFPSLKCITNYNRTNPTPFTSSTIHS